MIKINTIYSFIIIGFLTIFPVQAHEVWRITSLEWPPFTGKNLPEGGSAIKVLREALKTQGIELKVDYFPWSRAIESARSTDIYVGVYPCWPEDVDRYAKGFENLLPIISSPIGIAQHTDKPFPINTISDLKDKYIGIVQSYGNTDEFNKMAEAGKIRTDISQSDLDGLRALNKKRTDGMLIDINVMNYILKYQLKEAESKIIINQGWKENKPLLLAVPENHPKKEYIKKTYTKAISSIKAQEMAEKYNEIILNNH